MHAVFIEESFIVCLLKNCASLQNLSLNALSRSKRISCCFSRKKVLKNGSGVAFFFVIILVISISFKHSKTWYCVFQIWLLTYGLPWVSVRLTGGNNLLEKVGEKPLNPIKI